MMGRREGLLTMNEDQSLIMFDLEVESAGQWRRI